MQAIQLGGIRLAVLGTLLPFVLLASDPWEGKEPASWSEKEIRKIISDSPWARPVTITVGMPGSEGPGSGRRAPRSGVLGGGATTPSADQSLGRAASVASGSGGESGAAPSLQFTVCWLSAFPVRAAFVKMRLGAEMETSEQAKSYLSQEEQYYIITVAGLLPGVERGAPGDSSPGLIARLTDATTLGWKDHEKLHPEAVNLPADGRGAISFRFSKAHRIELEDKEVDFTTHFGSVPVKCRFKLKNMLYKGALSL